MAQIFITGTDTGVGKTWFTSHLVEAWRAEGKNAAALKPIATGDREDVQLLWTASGHALSLDEINPVHFRMPAAPLLAARAENRKIDFFELNRSISELALRFSHLAVEGVGGWRVPLAENYEVRDWARDLGLPVVVVALDRLGMLNHTLLTVENVRATGLRCSGVVVNPGPEGAGSPDLDLARRDRVVLLETLLDLPVFELERGGHTAREIALQLGSE